MGQWKLLNYFENNLTNGDGRAYSKYKWRKRILARDKDTCQNCLNSIKDIYRNERHSNEAHHIYARRHGGKNTLNNGITLCKFCHAFFDYMYSRHDQDYYGIIQKKSREQRIREVKEMMHRQYLMYALWKNFE